MKELKEQVAQLLLSKAEVEELKERVAHLEQTLEHKERRIAEIEEDLVNDGKLARAICELQEELQRKMPDLYFINKIYAPTRVGMN